MRVGLTKIHRRRAAARTLLMLALLVALVAAWMHEPASAQGSSSQSTPSGSRSSQSTPRASTLADYRKRVRRSFELVEDLARIYEGEDDEEATEDEENEDDTVEDLLPPREKIEWNGRAIEVDNTWVYEALKKTESEEEDEKIAAELRSLAGRLRSLDARLAEMETGTPAEVDRDAERGRLNSILRRPEFDRQAPKQPGALERLIEDFAEWLRSLFPKGTRVTPGASPRVSTATLIIVSVLCLAVVLYVVFLVLKRRGLRPKALGLKRKARVVLGERLEADQTASDLLDEAERLARSGELRGAIRKAYVALLCELGDRGVVRLAQHKTNRDYLDAVRRAARPHLYTEMLPLTSDFELHWYGLRPASDTDWESFRTRCRKALSEAVAG
jgi:TolA-binding protein